MPMPWEDAQRIAKAVAKDGARQTFELKLSRGLVPLKQKYGPGQTTQKVINQAVTQHLERNIWVVTKVYGDNYYDIAKGSTLVMQFDFTTGKLDFQNAAYNNTNPVRHSRVFNQTGTKLIVGSQCRITYRDHNITQKPEIIQVLNLPFPQKTTAEEIIYAAGLWAQSLSSGGLNPLALFCYRPDQTASMLTAWAGLGGQHVDFPVLLDKDARPVLSFAERNPDNSNWDKLRVVVATGTSTQLTFECPWTGADVLFNSGFSATDSTAFLVYFSESNSRRAWRKRGEVLEEIFLSALSVNHSYDQSNMSDLGLLIFPRYHKYYNGTISYAEHLGGTPPGSPFPTWTADELRIETFDLNQAISTLSKTSIDCASFFSYTHPGLAEFSGAHAFDSKGRMLAWASTRESFTPGSTGFDAAACVGWESTNFQTPRPPGGDFIYPNQAHLWGRKIAGVIACLNNGSIVWKHTIERLASDPLENAELIDPFEAVFATQMEDNTYTDENAASAFLYPANEIRPVPYEPYSSINWGGIAEPGAINSSQRRIISDELGSLYFGTYYLFSVTGTGVSATGHVTSGGNFPLPRYDHFNAVQIELLPRGRNLTKALKLMEDESKRDNWDVYASWAGPTSQEGSSVVVKRPEDTTYVCYTAPVSCFYGGFSTIQGYVSDAGYTAPYAFPTQIQSGWNQYYLITPPTGSPYTLAVDPFTYPLWATLGGPGYGLGAATFINADQIDVTGHYVRGLSYLSRRYMRKIAPEGTLVWETDFTQSVIGAECWRTRTAMGLRPPGGELVGGVSTIPLPLGDDMGPARPCGRVVFCPCDFHEVGPNFLPTQRLLVVDDADGSLLHTLPLIDAGDGLDPDEVLADDVREPSTPITGSTSGEGDGVSVEFTLSEFAESLVEALVDGFPVDATLSVDGLSVIFAEPPGLGTFWTVEYVTGSLLGEVIWEAGEKRFDATVTVMHCGVDPANREWGLFGLQIIDRLPGEDNRSGIKTMRLRLSASSLSVPPDCDWVPEALSPRVAIHGGSIYKLENAGVGTPSAILKKTNPSTT